MPVAEPIRVFIGYDFVESVAYHTLCHSIIKHSSNPVSITPIKLEHFAGVYRRERDPKQSNDFSFIRFLVPWLCDYKGYAIFMDCDMLCRSDISELYRHANFKYAVQVVKHNYTPKDKLKYLGNTQYQYEKKNWSSVMLFNNDKCRALTPKYVNESTGLELHQFKWLEDDNLIGELPVEWNHLVGEYNYDPGAKLVHFTVGGPYFDEYKNCDYSDEWFLNKKDQENCMQLSSISNKVKVK